MPAILTRSMPVGNFFSRTHQDPPDHSETRRSTGIIARCSKNLFGRDHPRDAVVQHEPQGSRAAAQPTSNSGHRHPLDCSSRRQKKDRACVRVERTLAEQTVEMPIRWGASGVVKVVFIVLC